MQALGQTILAASVLVGSLSGKDFLVQKIHEQVTLTIANSDNIPGLQVEEFKRIKTNISDRWDELVVKGVIEVSGKDVDVRSDFVALQAIVEHVLAHEFKKSITSLTGIIHTPMPATPLCNNGTISEGLVHPEIEEDPTRLFTVNARTTIIRDYLYQGGDLYIVYPKDGLALRKPAEQELYKAELSKYSNLFDRPLDCDFIESGAFYIFKNENGKSFAFAIKMTQANNPLEDGHYALWFGELDQPEIKDRISGVLNSIRKSTNETFPLPI